MRPFGSYRSERRCRCVSPSSDSAARACWACCSPRRSCSCSWSTSLCRSTSTSPSSTEAREADPAWDVLHWIVPWFPGAPSQPRPRNWFGVAVAISALVALSGRKETKRLHAWLFLVLGVFLLAKIYGFGLLEWVGRLPVAKLVVFPIFAAPVVSFAFAVLAGSAFRCSGVATSDCDAFSTLLASALTVLVACPVASDRWRVITSRPRASRSGVEGILRRLWPSPPSCSPPGSADAGPRRSSPASSSPSSSGSRRSTSTRREPTHSSLRLDATRPSRPGRRAVLTRVRDRRQAVSEHRRRARAAGHPRARRAVRRAVLALRANVHPAGRVRSVHRERSESAALPGATRCSTRSACALCSRSKTWRTCRRFDSSAKTATRASTRTPTPIHGLGSCTTFTSSRGEDDAFEFLEAHARRRDGAFIVNTFDPRHEAVVEDHGKTDGRPCAALQDGRDECAGATATGDHRALLRQTP